MSQASRSSSGPSRWQGLLLVLLIPSVLCGSAVKVARAASYKLQPIVCDGVDDDADAFVICGLPENTVEKSSLTNVNALPGRRISPSRLTLPRLARLQTQRRPLLDSRFRSTHPTVQRQVCPDDPDIAH